MKHHQYTAGDEFCTGKYNYLKVSCRNQKDVGIGDEAILLANKVHIYGMKVLLADSA